MNDDHEERLMIHLVGIPDAKEVFTLVDLLRDMGAITAEEASRLMSQYWEVG